MTNLAAFIAAWKLRQLRRQLDRDVELKRDRVMQLRADFAGYGDNGTEASWAVVDNFR